MSSESDFRKAAKAYRAAQAQLERRREELTAAMEAARAEGMTLASMADELGVTRQRVMQMLRD